jgi:hypothetical protein
VSILHTRPHRHARPRVRALLLAAAAIAAAAAGLPSSAAAAIGGGTPTTIDDFSTNQSALTLTFPPSGTSASSSASGAGILGGERDLQVNLTGGVIAGNVISSVVSSGFLSYSQDATISGSTALTWDGADGSSTFAPSGLGTVDLTAGGTQNAFDLNVFFDDLPVNISVVVYSDSGHASSATFTPGGQIFSAKDFVIPFAAFTPALGGGANFASIGAIQLQMGSSSTAPDVVLDSLTTDALVRAPMTATLSNDVNANGLADPGDTIRYTTVVSNPADMFGAVSEGTKFALTPDPGSTLVAGAVTTTQGTVTTGNGAGDASAAVNIGTIADGSSVTVTADAKVNASPASPLSAQGTVTSDTLTALRTDDPSVPGTADPTNTVVTTQVPYATTIAADAPSGYWRFGEPAGATTAVDSSGNANNGTYLNGPTLAVPGALTGDANTAASFDGVNDSVRVPDASSLDVGDTFSLEGWIKRSSTAKTYELFNKGGNGLQLTVMSAANGNQVWLRKANVTTIAHSTTGVPADAKFHQIVVTKSGPNSTKIYIDGVDAGAVAVAPTQAIANTALPLTITGAGAALHVLDELALYNHVLTAARVSAHYAAGT